MKKLTLISFATVALSLSAVAQVTSLHQNFDVDCAVTTGFPMSSAWLYYNPLAGTDPDGIWHCTPTGGRENSLGSPTPGMTCTGIWSSAYHTDTSFLVSPQISLAGYTGDVFLRFDTKADSVTLDGRVSIMYSYDTLPLPSMVFFDSTSAVTPPFGPADSSGWVTHEMKLNGFVGVGAPPFYIGFRYTSNDTSGSRWYLDNVNITTVSLHESKLEKTKSSLSVLGSPTSSNISLSFDLKTDGRYRLSVSDMMGRIVFNKELSLSAGVGTYNISGAELVPGMYFIKLDNGISNSLVKVIVQ